MDNFPELIANDNENNANAILKSLLVGEDVEQHVPLLALPSKSTFLSAGIHIWVQAVQ